MRDLNRLRVRPGRASLFLVCFLALFFLVGAGFSIFGGFMLIKSMNSSSWPSTNGVVKTAEMRTDSGDDGTTYGVDICYDYSVNGKPLKGYKIRMVNVSSSNRLNAGRTCNDTPRALRSRCSIHPAIPPTACWNPAFILQVGLCRESAARSSFFP